MLPKREIRRQLTKSIKQPRYAFQAFYKRLKSYLTYKLYNGRSAYPETISLFLTYRCNLRCKMCGQWGETGSSYRYTPELLQSQLSLDEMERLLNDLATFKPNVTLFGGEPMLYRDWTEVVRMTKARGMRCNMITNGVLLEAKAEAIMDAGIDEIIFSLDGPRDIHDEIRSAPGTYEKAMAGFKKIARLKTERKVSKPLVNISTAIFETNYKRLNEVIRSAEEMGASSITFHHLIFIGKNTYSKHDELFQKNFSCSSTDWLGFLRDDLPDIDPDILLYKIREIKATKTYLGVSFYPNLTDDEIRRYYTNFDFLPDSYRKRCLSPWMVAYIFPDGSVGPCLALNYSIGNIKESKFTDIWNGEAALKFRKMLKEEKYFPVCPRCTEFYRF